MENTATQIDRDAFNGLNARRKANRESIARVLIDIGKKYGARYTRRDDPACAGFGGQGIVLRFDLQGVGAMIDIDDLHGGHTGLIHWYNDHGGERSEVKYFSSRFERHVGASSSARPHHKATSCPGDWYSLAMMLDAGLMLAARGEAYRPSEA